MNSAAYQQCLNPACGSRCAIANTQLARTTCGSLLDFRYESSPAAVPRKFDRTTQSRVVSCGHLCCRLVYECESTIAQRKASVIKENLKAQAEVLGQEALATREVVGAAPAFTLPDFLSQYLQKRTFAPANGLGLSSDANAVLASAALAGPSAGAPHNSPSPPALSTGGDV